MPHEPRLSVFSDPDVDLLLMTHSLIGLAKGEKRAAVRRAWIAASRRIAARALGGDAPVPALDPHNAVMSLFQATLALADACGIPRVELVQHFNLRGESGIVARTDALDGAIADCFAFIMALATARQLQIARAAGEDDETPARAEGA
jgi:hypothetical protein